jgi:hypothetical protein
MSPGAVALSAAGSQLKVTVLGVVDSALVTPPNTGSS